MSKKSNNRHVMYDGELHKWVNKMEGNDRATSLHDTQQEAYIAARENLLNQGGGELNVHRKRDNAIRDKNTIGKKDPKATAG